MTNVADVDLSQASYRLDFGALHEEGVLLEEHLRCAAGIHGYATWLTLHDAHVPMLAERKTFVVRSCAPESAVVELPAHGGTAAARVSRAEEAAAITAFFALELRFGILYVYDFTMRADASPALFADLVACVEHIAAHVDASEVMFKGRLGRAGEGIAALLRTNGYANEAAFEGDAVIARKVEAPAEGLILKSGLVVAFDSDMLDAELLTLSIDERSKPHEAFVFVPHQDDELLTCGGAIIDSVREFSGRVMVTLLTDGKHCTTRLNLNNGKKCKEIDDEHVYDLSIERYGQLRDVEFIASCEAMGVVSGAAYLESPRAVDGQLTVEFARASMEKRLRAYPDALIITHAPLTYPEVAACPSRAELPTPSASIEHIKKQVQEWGPQHPDHACCGNAARLLFEEERATHLEYSVEFYHLAQYLHVEGDGQLATIYLTGAYAERVKAAIAAYRTWDPASERYALGHHGARKELNYLESYPECYRVVPLRTSGSGNRWQVARMAQLQARASEAQMVLARKEHDDVQKREKEVAKQRDKLAKLKGSTSYRVGHALTAVPRKIKKTLGGKS